VASSVVGIGINGTYGLSELAATSLLQRPAVHPLRTVHGLCGRSIGGPCSKVARSSRQYPMPSPLGQGPVLHLHLDGAEFTARLGRGRFRRLIVEDEEGAWRRTGWSGCVSTVTQQEEDHKETKGHRIFSGVRFTVQGF
jgi:hypothetical protein